MNANTKMYEIAGVEKMNVGQLLAIAKAATMPPPQPPQAQPAPRDERDELKALRTWKEKQIALDAQAHRAELEAAARAEAQEWARK